MKSFEAKVGAFVVACAIILGATIYFVGMARFNGAHAPYTTFLKNAAGIEPGTAVLFGGITVGKVNEVKPDKADPTRIEISLEVKKDTPLNSQSVAEVGAVSLMSPPALTISTGSNAAPRMQPGSIIPSQETLTLDELQHKVATLADTAQSTLVQANGNLNDISGDAKILLANLNDLTGSANRSQVNHILLSTNTMVTNLNPRLDQISEQALQLTREANKLAAKMEPTLDNLNATVGNANQTITAIRQPTQADLVELQRTLSDTRSLISALQGVVETNAESTHYTIENLRMATDNLNELTESLKERPWSMVRIRQPRDRQVPKREGEQ